MGNNYLQEAFKALDLLTEEDFNLNTLNGIDDLRDFIDTDDEEDTVINVIDPEATTEDELRDSYMGNVILDCVVCHSKLYKDPTEIVVDPEIEYVNVDDECPYCFSTNGFLVVGQVAPYDSTAIEKESEEAEEEDSSLMESKDTIEHAMDTLYDYLNNQEDLDKETKDAWLHILGLIDRIQHESVDQNTSTSLGRSGLQENFAAEDLSEYQKWVDYDMKKYGKISRLTMHKIKKAGFSVVKDQYGEYEVIADRKDECITEVKKPVKEHFEKVEIETDDQKLEMTSDKDGKVTVTTEPKKEVIGEVDEETKEIIDVENEVPKDSEEVETPDFTDIDINDFSEEEFNELGESYLKKVYENITSFKTTQVSLPKDKLIIEGIIAFNSGKQKKTSFIFEAKDITKSGKLRFIGENTQITRGKKAFTLFGSFDSGKFIAESLNYNYRTKNSSGKSSRVYGTLKLTEEKAHKDLSTKEGTLSKLFIDNKDRINNTTTRDELAAVLKDIIKDNNSPKIKEIEAKINSIKDHTKLLSYVYNFILKGDNVGSIERKTVNRNRDKK